MARTVGQKIKVKAARHIISKSIDIGEQVLKATKDTAYTVKSIAKENVREATLKTSKKIIKRAKKRRASQ